MKKIMFVMLRTLGDVILGNTLCRELRRDFPSDEIHFMTMCEYEDIVKNSPWVDKVHARDWTIDALFMEMAFGDYDKCYFPYQVRRECNAWHQIEGRRHQHLLDFYWNRMGMNRPIEERECYLFPKEDDFKKAESLFTFDVPRIAVHSTSGVATKDWPYFNELTEELRKLGYGVVQVGGRNDKIVKGAVDLRGKMSFLELSAFLTKCAVFVGLDSGLSYMADAMRVPTIVIQGSTNPVTSGPISNRVIHLFAKETGYADCQEIRCHENCRHEINCNTKITVDMVIEKLDPILSSWKRPFPVGV